MRHWSIQAWCGLLLVLGLTSSAYAQSNFTLNDVPALKNKKPIHLILETGDGHSKALPIIEAFTKKTGVPVNVERVASSGVYGKENVELMAGTGHYDVVYVETSWTTEWSDLLYKLKDLANKVDPGKYAALEKEMANMSPSILATGQAYGNQMVLPFYTFDMAMWVRQDVFDDPTEKANFKTKYGYELAAAKTWDQLHDQAAFFTRKKGEMLKGQPLDHDLFGLSMQAGAFQDNDETTARLWSRGQDWMTVVRDGSGKITKFVVTKANKEAIKASLADYKKALQWDSPGALTANFDFVVAQIGNGNAIIAPTMWANCTVWADGILKEKVPGGKIGVYATPGGHPYTGAWSYGVAKSAKNPEAAYWLVRYLTSYEGGLRMFKEAGLVPGRIDVMETVAKTEPVYPLGMLAKYHIDIWKATGKFIPNYYYYNTKAGGKVYDNQIYVLNPALTGEKTIDQVVEDLTKQSVELQNKFDKTAPCVEEM